METTLIRTTELSRHYQRGTHTIKALDCVDLSIAKGEMVGVVGSSGSGKTTLLNLLAGLDTPTDGSVYVDGSDLSRLRRRELARYRATQVGLVFQSFNLIRHYSAIRNVESALFFSDIEREERERRSSDMLERIGLSDRASHRPADLSGGEQQRVAIARALVKRPAVLLADEPSGNLDQDNANQVANLLTELNREGQTIVLVTHDVALAETLCGRVIKLHYGRVVEESK